LFKLLDKPKSTQKGGGGEVPHQRHLATPSAVGEEFK